jgi:hypothetical protein
LILNNALKYNPSSVIRVYKNEASSYPPINFFLGKEGRSLDLTASSTFFKSRDLKELIEEYLSERWKLIPFGPITLNTNSACP